MPSLVPVAAFAAIVAFFAAPAVAQDNPQSPPPPPQVGAGPEAPPEARAKPGGPGAAERSAPPNLAAAPKDLQDRDAMLAELYAHLAHAPDAVSAGPITKTIEGLWAYTDSPTIGLLMNRAYKAVNAQKPDLALKLLDAVTDLAPDYAEGWSRRAYVYYMQNDTEHAVGDLRRTLALEPNHYKALDGLARILSESGQKKSALKAYQQLLRINPFMPGAKEAADALALEVEGRGI